MRNYGLSMALVVILVLFLSGCSALIRTTPQVTFALAN